MNYQRMIMEVESPEQIGYDRVRVNLAESSMRDRSLRGLGMDPSTLGELLLQYGDHRGGEALRSLIAADGDGGLTPDDVLVTVGAAGALFLTATALLAPGDRLVVSTPNYASNLETPRAIGAEIVPVELRFEEGFRLDLDRLADLIAPGTTLVSLTSPHNPTGAVIPHDDLRAIVDMVERAGTWLLLDETYRELADEVEPPASTLSDRVISVSSLSKTYGVPGIRAGWVTCRDRALMTMLLAAQEQIALAHSVLDLAVAEWVLANRARFLSEVRAHLAANRAVVRDWIATDDRIEWVEPRGGVVCFPRFTDPGIDARRIYAELAAEGIFVGPGWWFEQPDRAFRLGYGYPTGDELRAGIEAIHNATG
ncbi:MAG: pyridoxal phosphate-dependent aminotransferase [Thermomicrobiales bacterium]|nr:pyridoxal phosphate-dependent aminotransferase [Thermomicrobiales bacterium]